MFHTSFKGALRKILGASRKFQGCCKKVSRVFQGRLKGVSRQFQRRSKEVSGMFKESVKCVLRKFKKESFKGVMSKCNRSTQ